MSALLGIHHISAFTKSAKENHFFYTEVLGLRFVKNTVNQENTHIRHLFYGDYVGSPGTLLTFFELPRAGHSHLEDHYFSTVSLSVPPGSLPYWSGRLEKYGVRMARLDDSSLSFEDPDGLSLRLVASAKNEKASRPTSHTDIPAEKQLVKVSGVEIVVGELETEGAFLRDWLTMKGTEAGGEFTNEQETFVIRLVQSTSSKSTRFGKGAIDHLALAYERFSDLEQKKEDAENLGLTVEKLVDRGYFSSLYVKDPFGQRFELATVEPGFTVDESLEELGNNLALPDFLEPKRTDIEQQLEEN